LGPHASCINKKKKQKQQTEGENTAFDVDAVEKFLELAADDVEERVNICIFIL